MSLEKQKYGLQNKILLCLKLIYLPLTSEIFWLESKTDYFLMILRWFPPIKWRIYKSKSLKSNFYADMQEYQTLFSLCLQSLCPLWFYRGELTPPPYVGINTFLMRESVNLLRQKEVFMKNIIVCKFCFFS